MKIWDLIVVGGGAAGFFAAINAKLLNPNLSVLILEQSKDVLHKVRISGGGRCNVTHNCLDPHDLTTYYPRGGKELLGPFHKFGSKQTIEWFQQQGIRLKTESDGRMFPITDNSETIIQCFQTLVKQLGIVVLIKTKTSNLVLSQDSFYRFEVVTNNEHYHAKNVLLASGSSTYIWNKLATLGYKIIEPVPSLFTFNLPTHPICKLMGLSVNNVRVSIKDSKISTEGPLLITHWGLSGPAILKASAWGAIALSNSGYRQVIQIDWTPDTDTQGISDKREEIGRKKVWSNPLFNIPTRLWQFLIGPVIIDKDKNWASLSKAEMNDIIQVLKKYEVQMTGKTTFKEEFVTAGGVDLSQIDFTTFESKLHPGLYMAGEVLNIDAVTGGFNFQAAWTGGFLVAKAVANKV